MRGNQGNHARTKGRIGAIGLMIVFMVAVFLLPGWHGASEAEAALQYVGGNSNTGTGATYTISLTGLTGGIGTSAQAGDLVIVVTGWASAADGVPGVTTAGYTEEANLYQNDTRDANLSINWKIMGGTPDTSVTVSGFNNAANGGATVVHVWRGADPVTPMDVAVTTAVLNNSALPNSPSITPVTAGAYVLTVGLGTGPAAPTPFTAPAGYSNSVSVAGAGTTMSAIAVIASTAWTSGAEDPAAWTGTTSTSDSWAAGTLALRPAPPPVSGAGLLHNSDSTGSSKWGGSWGVSGGRYGAITCETCHERTTGNIKRIKDNVITAPNSPTNQFPAQVGSVAPVFTRVSGAEGNAGVMGDDSTNPRASSNKICEVCHTYDATGANGTKYHAYSGGVNDPAHQNNAKDCTGCHKHNQGFKAPACDSCHGNPPTTTTAGGPTGLANSPFSTGSTIAGGHAAHAVALGYGCSNCHNNQNMPQESSVKTGFGDISIGFSNWGATTGSYSGQSNVSYNNTLGTGTKTCSTVYCHGSSIGGPNTAAVWDGAAGSYSCASAPNGACHNASSTTVPTLGAHQRHATAGTYAAGTKQGLNVACTDCHGATAGASGHVGGNVSWSLNTASNKFSATAAYRSATTGSTGAVAPSGTYGSCTNIYCHSTVQPDGGTGSPTYQTISWSGSPTCNSCHADQTAAYTGKHQTHTTAPNNYVCATCHSGAGSETTKHADVSVDVSINPTYGGTYGGTAAPGDAYGSCSNVYCHGNFTGGLNATPAWGGTAACGTCHKYLNSDPPTNVNHPRHAGTAAGQLGLACTKCHPARAAKDGHEDLSVQWDLDRTDAKLGASASYRGTELGATGAKAPSASYGNCASVYCHSSVQSGNGTGAPTYASVTWGAASVTCDSCHGQGPGVDDGQPATGSHLAHVSTYGFTCAVCHNGLGSGQATHADHTINLSFLAGTAGGSAAYSRTASITPQSGTFGTCSTTFCHGDSTNTSADAGTWGTNLAAADACTVCHGTKTTAADGGAAVINRAPGGNATGVDTSGTVGTITRNVSNDTEVGAHDAHLRGLTNISNPIACTECHAVPAVTVAGIKGHLDGTPANMTWGALATTNGAPGSYDPVTHTCSNIYCHNEAYFPTSNHTNGGSGTSPVWNNINYFADNTPPLTSTECGRCHFYDGSNCSGCHYLTTAGDFVNADNLSFNATNKGLHINGSVTAKTGCTGCHGSPITGGTGESFRNVAADFTQPSRHVFGATVTDFDCIVCHAEGDTTSSGSSIVRSSEHTGVGTNDGSRTIAMRNVDAQANPGTGVGPNVFGSWTNNFWKWPKPSVAPTTNDHSNMDKFCMSCHDADGANTITVNAAFNGMTTGTGVARRLTPFSKNTVGGSLTDFGARTRVLDVKSQFKNDATAGSNEWPAGNGTLPTTFDTLAEGQGYDGNPSQHAVLGPRYATKNTNISSWVSGKTLKSGQTLATSAETSQLHCADCHSVDTNAHGSANANMLVQSTVDATCYDCHASGVYSAAAGAGSRIDHSMCGHTFDASSSAIWGGSYCYNCHAGAKSESPYGSIHGMPTGADPNYTTAAIGAKDTGGLNKVNERWRFMGGSLGAYATSTSDWVSTGTAVQCYMRTSANAYSNCTRHATGVNGSKQSTNFTRELKY